jgi:hypothetical protein
MKRYLLYYIWTSSILFLGVLLVSVRAADQTIVSVTPSSYTAPSIGVTFTINVTVQEVTNLVGYEFHLGYNPAILNVSKVEYGGIFGPTYLELKNIINNTEGYIWYAAGQMFGEPPINGSGVLAIITFTTIAEGSAPLDLYDTKLAAPNGVAIPHTVIDGSVTVIPEYSEPFILLIMFMTIALMAIFIKKRHIQKETRINLSSS